MQSNRIEMHYYTYAYLREDKTPYYIGKGKGNREYKRSRNDIRPPKDKSRVIYLKQNLTEEEAFKHEIYMIAVFGRKDLGTGILRNRTDGGEGVSGRILSQESRRKISEANKGNTNCLGKTHSEESRKKMSESQKGNTKMLGKTHSEETKRKMSDSSKGNTNFLGKTHSEETKRKMSESHKNPSEETRKKLSGAQKGNTKMLGKTHSEETKRKMSASSKGKKCWNDGCGNIKYMIECPGDDWRLGKK